MSKKVIQLPIDDNLLQNLNDLSKKQHKARAALIREACVGYIAAAEQAELERRYREGYEKIPETADTGAAQLTILKKIVPEEKW